MDRSKHKKAMITVEATSHEVIALQMAIHYYDTFFHRPTEEYRTTERLLKQFQDRFVTQLPTMPTTPRVLRGVKP